MQQVRYWASTNKSLPRQEWHWEDSDAIKSHLAERSDLVRLRSVRKLTEKA